MQAQQKKDEQVQMFKNSSKDKKPENDALKHIIFKYTGREEVSFVDDDTFESEAESVYESQNQVQAILGRAKDSEYERIKRKYLGTNSPQKASPTRRAPEQKPQIYKNNN
jgi:hypothetical protein